MVATRFMAEVRNWADHFVSRIFPPRTFVEDSAVRAEVWKGVRLIAFGPLNLGKRKR